MKSSLIIFMIVGLTAGSVLSAEAKKAEHKRVERTLQGSYISPSIPFAPKCARDSAPGCLTFETRENERFLTAEVSDAHGRPVFVTVEGPDPTHPPHFIRYGTFCGETTEPIAFPRGVDVRLRVAFWITDLPTSLRPCLTMLGTAGTISVTLSNLP